MLSNPVRAFVAFGANLGNPTAALTCALTALDALPETRVVACSSRYHSAPLGVPEAQPDYINAAIALDTGLSPRALLDALLEIETAAGRRRNAPLAPRPIDLDLLLHGDVIMQSPALTLPHPRLHQRGFVLLPLMEIAPDLIIPGIGSLAPLLEIECVRKQRVVRVLEAHPSMPLSRFSPAQ